MSLQNGPTKQPVRHSEVFTQDSSYDTRSCSRQYFSFYYLPLQKQSYWHFLFIGVLQNACRVHNLRYYTLPYDRDHISLVQDRENEHMDK